MTYDKTVLVTGGAGFIGSNLLRSLIHKYPSYFFLCIDKLNYASVDLKTITATNFKFVKLDLTNLPDVKSSLDVHKVTDILNLAAESCVDRSFESPLYFTTNNILSTQNILEYVRVNPHIRLVHVSTDEVYGEQLDTKKVDETGKLNPTNPYSATKASIDLIIRAYEYSFGLKSTIVRPNNVYGPGQYPEKIIPMALHNLKLGNPILLHGDGHHKRSYLYISDFIEALDLIWHSNLYGIYNVGSPHEISNLELIRLILQLSQRKEPIDTYVKFVKDRNYNDSS
ncbi:dTDP-glucose 4,6-dehydratase [Yamadazyma tenuis]|uniref:dTDP-glucose 4,6-dehydratase n=1 Tax=Candida tenuis TaxID=2315449 RepID=UPI00279C865A|nr:dTDP-glucose 4,6-dehydratase [Yamadazyma tenuis]